MDRLKSTRGANSVSDEAFVLGLQMVQEGYLVGGIIDEETASKLERCAEAVTKHAGWQDAGRHVFYAHEALTTAQTLPEQAAALTDLSNAVSDLATWISVLRESARIDVVAKGLDG